MISVVIIDFNSYKRTLEYIFDFTKYVSYSKISFIIVDNSIEKENYNKLKKELMNNYCVEKIKCEYSNKYISDILQLKILKESKLINLSIIKSKDNYGFAKGNNIGAKFASEIFKPDFIIFSNNDILFKYKCLNLRNLIKKFTLDDRIALIGPRVVGLDNIQQSPCSERSIWERWNMNSIIWPLNKIININKLNTANDTLFINKNSYVYRIIGAFMIFDMNKFLDIGMFDENTFLFAEELIIAERLKKFGYKTFYCDEEVIIHEQGATTKKSITNFNKLKIRFNSEMYYYQNYKNINSIKIKISRFLFNQYILKLKLSSKIKKYLDI